MATIGTQSQPVAFDRVVVIGLGLIGGSLAKALAPVMEVVGVDPDSATCEAAARDGIRTAALEAAIHDNALVIVAVPVQHIAPTFAQLRALETRALITDVCSVKSSVLAEARSAGLRFVGGHPMAGSERHGYEASIDSLFSGARWALTIEADTALSDWLAVAELVISVGAGVVPLTAVAHDDAVAAVSHLPHVVATALASAVGSEPLVTDLRLGLAAGSFRDGTRVARAPAPFWTSVVAHNAPAVSAMVEALAHELLQVSAALQGDDLATVEAFFAHGAQVRAAFDERTSTVIALTASDDAEMKIALLQLGRDGGFVTNIEAVGTARALHARVPTSESARR